MKQRILTISYCVFRKNKKVPLIRLMGKWLSDKGFSISDKVVVYQRNPNELIIKKKRDKY